MDVHPQQRLSPRPHVAVGLGPVKSRIGGQAIDQYDQPAGGDLAAPELGDGITAILGPQRRFKFLRVLREDCRVGSVCSDQDRMVSISRSDAA